MVAQCGTGSGPLDLGIPRARVSLVTLRFVLVLTLLAGCGGKTGLSTTDEPTPGFDAGTDGGRDGGPIPDGGFDGCMPAGDGCGRVEICDNGSDDDCNGLVDDGCPCAVGAVESCFAGPPGRRGLGACQDGEQVCGTDGQWGPCRGGVLPNADACTGRDDLCTGCPDNRVCPIDCPSPGDPRVGDAAPFEPVMLNGRDFYVGPAEAWSWTIEGGPCDRLAPRLVSFDLSGASTEQAVFTPRLSGDYRVTLAVTVPGGEVRECSWVVTSAAPGLRVEMCYAESESADLDLYLHRPNDTTPWFGTGGTAFDPIPEASCGWHNCEADIRLMSHPETGAPVTRADWGFEDSPLSRCENGPLGDRFRDAVGSCPNPRLDIDNNLSPGRIGLPENINVDNPNDGDVYRIMVQNFTGEVSEPVVNVYCGGRRVATFGEAPNQINNFRGPSGGTSPGAMWRVADVTVSVDPATGETTDCDARLLRRPGMIDGFYLTVDDPSY